MSSSTRPWPSKARPRHRKTAMKSMAKIIEQAVSLCSSILFGHGRFDLYRCARRRFFNTPVFGANDITEHLMALIIFAGLPLLTARRGHLSIDLLDHWMLRPSWRGWHKAVDVLIAAVLGLIAWQYGLAVEEAYADQRGQPGADHPARLDVRLHQFHHRSGRRAGLVHGSTPTRTPGDPHHDDRPDLPCHGAAAGALRIPLGIALLTVASGRDQLHQQL